MSTPALAVVSVRDSPPTEHSEKANLLAFTNAVATRVRSAADAALRGVHLKGGEVATSTQPASSSAPPSHTLLEFEMVDDYVPQGDDEKESGTNVVTETSVDRLLLERRHRPADKLRNECCYACQTPLKFGRLGNGANTARYCFYTAVSAWWLPPVFTAFCHSLTEIFLSI